MKKLDEGLRCQDVHAGLRNLDVNSAPIAQHLEQTQLVGMAATLAAAIRGEDVIGDAQALKVIAADQLDINAYAFPAVVELLHERDMVRDVRTDSNNRIVSFSENVSFHAGVYESLGDAWEDSHPDDVAIGVVQAVDLLAASPVSRDDLRLHLPGSRSEQDQILDVGLASELIKIFPTPDGDIVYSPFHGFEHPDTLVSIFASHGSSRVQEELEQLRRYQGFPVGGSTPVLLDAVDRGLLAAPSVEKPDGTMQPFAFLPYSIDRSFFTVKKSIMEKALAILACVRCGQHFGGVTNIRFPSALLRKLASGIPLAGHSSARRQYEVLYRMRIVRFGSSEDRATVQFIDTDDNKAAIALARDLLEHGQQMNDRVGESEATKLLSQSGPYRAPMQTIRDRRGKVGVDASELRSVFEALMMGRDQTR